jgi:hypothetical protein
MKKFLSIITVAAALATAITSVASAEIKVSGDVYAGPYSKYLFRGHDLSGNQWVVQGGADLTYKDVTLSYWSNYQTHAFEYGNRSDVTETDITLNYAFSPSKLLSMNVGNTYYTFDGLRDTNELYLKTALNTLLTPTLAIYFDWDEAQSDTYDGTGLFFTLSVGHSFELAKGLNWNFGALASYNMENISADFSKDTKYNNLHNYELSTSIDYSLTDAIKISPSYFYSTAFNHNARKIGMKDENVFGIKAAFIF